MLAANAMDKMQSYIRADAGGRLDKHTRVLPVLMVGDHVQLQTWEEIILWNLIKMMLLTKIMVSVIIQSEFLAVD